MQEQIFRGSVAAPQQLQQQQQQQSSAQLRMRQLSRNTQEQSVSSNQSMIQRQKNQQLQTKIVTPTKSAQYELLAVKEVFYQVEEAFKMRELEKSQLQDQVNEKESQIKYCEEQTRKQAEAIGILTASNSFRNHKISQLNAEVNRFNEDMVDPLRDRCSDMDEKLSAADSIIAALEADLKPLQLVAQNQRKKAAEISVEVAAFDEELRIQTVELARLNIVNAAAEDRIKALRVEAAGMEEMKMQVEEEYSQAEQHFHLVQIQECTLKKALEVADESHVQQLAAYSDSQEENQQKIRVAKDAIAASEKMERDAQHEVDELCVQLSVSNATKTSILDQIHKAEIEKESISKKHIVTNERLSCLVLERKRVVALTQEAKNRGDQLNDEVTAAREILERTTDRAKEHEQNMQEGYAFMGEKMKEQYELQKLEPGLRCELLQLQETLNKKIRDLKLSVDVIAGQANDEERKNDVMEKENIDRIVEIRQRESITLGQEEECSTLEGSIAAVLEKTTAALLQEERMRAELGNRQSQVFHSLQDKLESSKVILEESNKRVGMIRERNEETLNHILNEKAAIDGGIQVWEPSDSLRASVEVAFEVENLRMMQNLEVAFRDKERKLQEHISKLKQGFPIPAAWETNMAKTRARCSQEESKNRVIASDIDLAAKQVSDRKAYTIIKAEENKQLELQIANEIASTAALISSTALRAASANVHDLPSWSSPQQKRRSASQGPSKADTKSSTEALDIIAEEERLSQHALLADLQDSEEGDLILDDSQNEDIFSQSCLTLTQRHNLVGKLLDGTENSESSQKRQRIQDFVKEGEYFGRQRASQIENQALRGESTASQIKNNRSQQRLEHQTAASQQGRFRNEPREQLLSSPQTNQRKNVSAGGKSSQIPVQRNSELKGDLSHQRLEHHSKSPTPLPASSMTAASNSQKRSTILTKVNNEGLKSNQGKNKNSESLKTSMRSEYSASSDDDDIVLKDNAAGNAEDDSGWVTESSACFEDTLFSESPKKSNTAIRSRNTTAAFIPFGGAVVKTRDTVNHHNVQGENSKSTIKRKFGGDASSRGTREIQAGVTNPRQASMKQAADLLDKHDMHEEDSRTEKTKAKGFIREDNGNKPSIGNDKSRTAMMGPPLAPPAGNYKNTSNSNHILPNNLPPKRKPLSSVGLSAIKSGVVAENTVAQSTNSRKSSLSGPAFPPSAKSNANTDAGLKQAGEGQLHKGARSIAPKQDNTSRQYQTMDNAVKKKSLVAGKDKKAGSPGDWFDDDIKF